MEYIMSAGDKKDCIFCVAAHDGEGLVLYQNELVVVLLNRFPYTNGHIMVAPSRHVSELGALSTHESHALMDALQNCEQVLKKEYQPQGMNIGINEGTCSGAGIPGHIHIHLVPRWVGDTNFMPAIGNVRVLPESLDETLERLMVHFKELD